MPKIINKIYFILQAFFNDIPSTFKVCLKPWTLNSRILNNWTVLFSRVDSFAEWKSDSPLVFYLKGNIDRGRSTNEVTGFKRDKNPYGLKV